MNTYKASSISYQCNILEDFNINFLNNTDTNTIFINIMASSYFITQITIPTRLNNEGYFTSLIDISSNTKNKSVPGTIAYDISDHLHIFFCMYNNNNNNNCAYKGKQKRHIRNFTKLNINKLTNKISQESWKFIYDQNNQENTYDNSMKILLSLQLLLSSYNKMFKI